MSESPAERPKGDDLEAEPNFVRVRSDAITEENWTAYATKGFWFLFNVSAEEEADQVLKEEEGAWGAGNVRIGHAFDVDEGRPLRHKPGVGIYIGPEGAQYYDRTRPGTAQSPSDIGPASS